MITIAATSRFHYEKLALELDSRGLLYRWLTSMPQSKILSIKRNKINSFLVPMLLNYIASTCFRDQFFLRSFIEDNANHLFDLYCLNQVSHSSSSALIGLSHNICLAGIAAKKNNKLLYAMSLLLILSILMRSYLVNIKVLDCLLSLSAVNKSNERLRLI